jgi:hypothetical protein
MFKLFRIIVVIILAVLVFLYFSIGGIIKTGVETAGPMVLKVPVFLEEADVSLLGSGELTGLTVKNPEGFESDYLFQLGQVSVSLDPLSLLGDTLHIKEVIVDSPRILFEGSLVRSNLKTLLDQLSAAEKTEPQPEEPSGETPAPVEKSETPEKKLIIDHLLIKGVTLGYSNALLGGRAINLKLPDLEKRDIGKEEGGVPATKVVEDLVKEIYGSAVSSIKKSGDRLSDNLKELNQKMGNHEEVNKAADKVKEMSGKVNEELEKAKGKFGKLFGK